MELRFGAKKGQAFEHLSGIVIPLFFFQGSHRAQTK